jgi:hypothetical protein
VQHQADVEPRLPAGTLPNLAADLKLLGADPNPQPAPAPAPGQPAPAPPPTLEEAMAAAVALISAIHDAILGSKASAAVRKAFGVSTKAPSKEPKAVVAEGEKIVGEAQANPTQALALGILPADTDKLAAALAQVKAAEEAAKAKGGKTGATAKELQAAAVRMHEEVRRIAGVGALAFATNAAVRAQFETLKPAKKA